jgi:hypothetical protein
MKGALGLALAVVLLVPAGVAAQDTPHPTVISDDAWCTRMLPGKSMQPARARCSAFLRQLRQQGLAAGLERTQPLTSKERADFVLPDAVISVLVWGEADSLGIDNGRASIDWNDVTATPTPRPTPPPTPKPTPTPTPKPTPTPDPKAMTPYWSDPALSFRWLKSSEYSCSYGSCWGMLWTTTKDCDWFYVELQVLDKDDIVIGTANDVASLSAGQSAKMVFETFESGARKARLQDVSCY